MWNPTPWMVDGARHSAAVGRLVAYASFGEGEGIVPPAALKVTALGSPGAAVAIAPGGAIILNRYPGGSRQTYVGLNVASHQVTIAPTTSAGGRTDLVVARVVDPEFEAGLVVPDPLNYQYVYTEVIQGVSSAVTSAKELNLNYPAVALAKVTLPASTSAVTSGMITDLRSMARPREHREIFVGPTGTSLHEGPWAPETDWFPYSPSVPIPSWATHIYVLVTVTSLITEEDLVDGTFRAYIGSLYGSDVVMDVDQTGIQRHTLNLSVAGEIPSNMRGTSQELGTRIEVERGIFKTDDSCQASFDVQFYERAG